jgi:hypothetical protein
VLHVDAQAPLPLQLADAFGSLVVQVWPHAPQLALSVSSLTHALPQRVVGELQLGKQCPPPQLWPAGHWVWHCPQSLLSVCVSTHTPPQRV